MKFISLLALFSVMSVYGAEVVEWTAIQSVTSAGTLVTESNEEFPIGEISEREWGILDRSAADRSSLALTLKNGGVVRVDQVPEGRLAKRELRRSERESNRYHRQSRREVRRDQRVGNRLQREDSRETSRDERLGRRLQREDSRQASLDERLGKRLQRADSRAARQEKRERERDARRTSREKRRST